MIEETAIVTRVGHGRVWIKSQPGSACAGCMQQSSCGTATLAKLLPKRQFAVNCELPLQTGDQVRVAIDDSGLLMASLLLYLLPLLVMLLWVVVINQLLPAIADWLPEIALAALLAAFCYLHHLQASLLLNGRFRPSIVGKC